MGDPIVLKCKRGGDAYEVSCYVKKNAPTNKVKQAVSRKAPWSYPYKCAPANVYFSGNLSVWFPVGSPPPVKPGYQWRGYTCLNKTLRRIAPPEGKLVYLETGSIGTKTPKRSVWVRCNLSKQEVKRAICFAKIRGDRWKTCNPQHVRLLPPWPKRRYSGTCIYPWSYRDAIIRKSATISTLAKLKKNIQNVVIYFVENSSLLSFSSQKSLNRIASVLKKNGTIKLEVGGHASKEGTAARNLLLSRNRALAVYKYLINRGVSSSQLSFKAYGTSIDSGRGVAANRRVSFKVN